MDITKDFAITVLRYLDRHKHFYFPFSVVCKEYEPEDNDFVEVEPEEWRIIAENETCQTFQLWENLQDLHTYTTKYMVRGFLEEMGIPMCRELKKKNESNVLFGFESTFFVITKAIIEELFEEIVSGERLGLLKKLSDEQLRNILSHISSNRVLAKDIRNSIRGSIKDFLDEEGINCRGERE